MHFLTVVGEWELKLINWMDERTSIFGYMIGNQIIICQRWMFFFFMSFEFVIRLDFNKEKLKKSRLKIERLSALDIMVIENAINAISVSILRPFLTKGFWRWQEVLIYFWRIRTRSNVIAFVQLFTSCNFVWFFTRIIGNRDGFVSPY